jgi:hypothetical protein
VENEKLVKFIARGLRICSLENYLGLNLPPKKHTMLGNSALGFVAFKRSLHRERRENGKLLQQIKKTCQVDYKIHLLN